MSREAASGIWKILKYYEPVMIIAKYYVQFMLFFVYNRSREIFDNAQETFLRLKKTNTGVYVRNNLFTSMEEMIDSFFCETCTNHTSFF